MRNLLIQQGIHITGTTNFSTQLAQGAYVQLEETTTIPHPNIGSLRKIFRLIGGTFTNLPIMDMSTACFSLKVSSPMIQKKRFWSAAVETVQSMFGHSRQIKGAELRNYSASVEIVKTGNL